MNGAVVAFSGTTGEEDLTRCFATEETRDNFTSFFDLGFQVGAKTIAAGWIPPFLAEIGLDCLLDFWKNWRGGVVVEVDH